MQNLPTSVIKRNMFLEAENVGIIIIVDRTREKFLFISHLVAFMYLESTENCAYGPLFKNCYCLDV